MKRRAYIYARQSLSATKQQNSIAVQTAVVTEFAKSHGYDIVDVYTEYASGGLDDRPVFNKVLKLCIEEQAYLLTHRVDRLSRSITVFSRIKEALPLLRFAQLGGDTEPSLL